MSSSPNTPGFIGIPQRLDLNVQQWKTLMSAVMARLRVAMPGIIQSFDADKQTAVIQLAVTESPRVDGVPTPTPLFQLLDIPISMPRGGNFVVTMPIQPGDECLVVFTDVDFSAWWQSGGVQNPIHPFRHGLDLSSAIAIVGPWSQPNKLSDYSTNSMQLRSLDGTVLIDLKSNEIDITAPTVKINGTSWATHEHSGVQSGGSNTGGVV